MQSYYFYTDDILQGNLSFFQLSCSSSYSFLVFSSSHFTVETEGSVVFPSFGLLLIKGYFTSRERTEHHHSHVLPGGVPLCYVYRFFFCFGCIKRESCPSDRRRDRESKGRGRIVKVFLFLPEAETKL
jgi:hypothetical protein